MIDSVTEKLNRSSCCCNSPAQIGLIVIVDRAAANSGWKSHLGFSSLPGMIHPSSFTDVATSQYRWSTFSTATPAGGPIPDSFPSQA